MRADRLVSLVLLLRQRGRMSATALARELEVSTRTVLRDIEALSFAGVPVFAERGRHGGFELLPGFRTELTGLTPEESLALLSSPGRDPLGLGSALSSAMRKVVDALPEGQRATAENARRRLLMEPESDLLSRPLDREDVPAEMLSEVRTAVLTGRRLRIRYAATGQERRWRTVDPIGLVTVRDLRYLLALRDGEDRTYRLSRIDAAECLTQPADRPDTVDLGRIWRERSERFLASGAHLTASVRVSSERRGELLDAALAVRAEAPASDGWAQLEVIFHDERHAVWVLWGLGTDAEALTPPSLREALRRRGADIVALYGDVG